MMGANIPGGGTPPVVKSPVPELVIQGTKCTDALAKMLEEAARLFEDLSNRIKAIAKKGVDSAGEQELKDIFELLERGGKPHEKVMNLLEQYQKDMLEKSSGATQAGCKCDSASVASAVTESFNEALSTLNDIARLLREMAKGVISEKGVRRLHRYEASLRIGTALHTRLKEALDQYEREFETAFGKPFVDTSTGVSDYNSSRKRMKP